MIVGVMEPDRQLIERLQAGNGTSAVQVRYVHIPLTGEPFVPGVPDRPVHRDDGAPAFDAWIVYRGDAEIDIVCDVLDGFASRTERVPLVAAAVRGNGADDDRLFRHCAFRAIPYVVGGGIEELAAGLVAHIAGRMQAATVRERDKLIVFAGSTPNVGTTVAAFGTSLKLAAATGLDIGYLCLNLKSSKIHRYLGLDEPLLSLDSIRAELRSQSLNRERLRSYMEPVRGAANLRFLCGNLLREQAEFYDPDDIAHLLKVASDAFDVAVVDVSAYWDNAATICALQRASSKIIVTTEQLTSFQEDIRRWTRVLCADFGMELQSFDLFVAQRSVGGDWERIGLKHIRKETGMNALGGMAYRQSVRRLTEEGRLAFLLREVPEADKELEGIVNTLAALYHLRKDPKRQDRSLQAWYRKLPFGLRGTRSADRREQPT